MRTLCRLALGITLITAACGDDGTQDQPSDAGLDDGGPVCLDDDLCGDNVDNDCDGTADEECEAGIGTFVSASRGDDANPGTVAEPVKTIGKGIANAVQLGGARTVIIAQGTYEEKVTLVEGVDLLGGHECNMTQCSFIRDIAAYPTTLANTDFEGVLAGPTITQQTLISGVIVSGLSGTPPTPAGSAGITCAGGCPTLRGNRIVAGTVAGGGESNNRSIGIAIGTTGDPNGVLVENNEISSGTATSASIAVLIDNTQNAATTLVKLHGNVIRSAASRRSTGVLALRTTPGSVLTNNDITSGSSSSGASFGLQVSSEILVDSNRINVDRTITGTCQQPVTWCAGILVEGSNATISNNVVLGPRGPRAAGLLLGQFERAAGTVLAVNNFLGGGGTLSSTNPVSNRSQSAAVVVSVSGGSFEPSHTVGTLINNILDAGLSLDRFGVREDPASGQTVHPTSLIANAFQFSSAGSHDDTFYRYVEMGVPIDLTTLTQMEAAAPTDAQDNIEDDCEVSTTYHLGADSFCIDAGKDLDVPAKDFEGDVRPQGDGPDIGPDEVTP